MGVSGSGKTTLGRTLADDCGWDFIEGDEHHPQRNIDKMRTARPLDDEDRRPWLAQLNRLMLCYAKQGRSAVVACSALKASYRRLLSQGIDDVRVVMLWGDPQIIRERLENRQQHFMPTELLNSQLAALEPPPDSVLLPIHLPTAEQLIRVRQAMAIRELL